MAEETENLQLPTPVIDQHIEQHWNELQVQPAANCSDSTFVRRIYLDLAGRIPTIAEHEAFVTDKRPHKKASLVQLLTASEDYVQHFADMFDALLMGRGSQKDYKERSKHQWRTFLEHTFRDNRPWNEITADILLARPTSNEERGAVWYLFERKDKYQEIAEAVAPAFFGIRIDCAQCHDHMMAHEIEQAHYWGLVAFFNRSKNVHTKNGPRVSEVAIGGFSEFADLEGDSSPNLLTFFESKTVPEARPDTDEKQDDTDELYVPASIEGDPRVPLFSRREQFVKEVATDHPLIARAFVNRIWAMLLGRGIVHPFNEMDSTHPPSHPELLDFLADDFRKSGYNIRRLVQSICLSRPYQLNSRRPEGVDDPASFAWHLERQLTAEQLARSMQLAVQGSFQNDDELVYSLRQSLREVMPKESVTTVKDALFLTNNATIQDFLDRPLSDQSLMTRVAKLPAGVQQSELLFQTVFGRSADAEEQQVLTDYLQVADNQEAVRMKQIVWAMLTSAEFRFNH